MNKTWMAIAGTLLVLCMLNGCIALGIGAAGAAGGVEYAEGRAASTVDASIERVYNAALAELKAQDLPVKHQDLGVEKADINSEYPSGDEIRIDIEAKSSDIAVLRVRIGLVGNNQMEIDLLNAIEKRV